MHDDDVKSEPVLDRLTPEERKKFDDSLANLMKDHPYRLLLQCPISTTNSADVRVTTWPESVREFDTLIAALKAARTAFLKNTQRGSR